MWYVSIVVFWVGGAVFGGGCVMDKASIVAAGAAATAVGLGLMHFFG